MLVILHINLYPSVENTVQIPDEPNAIMLHLPLVTMYVVAS